MGGAVDTGGEYSIGGTSAESIKQKKSQKCQFSHTHGLNHQVKNLTAKTSLLQLSHSWKTRKKESLLDLEKKALTLGQRSGKIQVVQLAIKPSQDQPFHVHGTFFSLLSFNYCYGLARRIRLMTTSGHGSDTSCMSDKRFLFVSL